MACFNFYPKPGLTGDMFNVMRSFGRGFLLVTLLFVGVLINAAPASAESKFKRPTVKSLLDKKFNSVSVTGIPKLQGRTIGLRFFMHANQSGQVKKPSMTISGGCNAFGSRFRMQKGRLASRGPFVSTSMACSVDPDRWLMRSFRKGLKARTVGRRLILERPASGVKLVFKQALKASQPGKVAPEVNEKSEVQEKPVAMGVPATEAMLQDKTFESIRVIGHKIDRAIKLSFTSVKPGRPDAGRPILAAYLGCNHMGGTYAIEDSQLTWFEVMMTDMLCYNRGNDTDSWFANFLANGAEATVDGSDLILTRGNEQIVLKQVS